MAKYKAKISYSASNNKKRKRRSSKKNKISRIKLANQNSPRAKAFGKRGRRKKSKFLGIFSMSKQAKANLKKVAAVLLGIVLIAATAAGIWLFALIQELDSQLPSADSPFLEKETASVIYDRNGRELYRVYNEFNRDPVNIEEVPPAVKWSFLAAEDVDFYTHNGFDVVAIGRCAFLNIRSGTTVCGGSTITQQMVKNTVLTNEVNMERKLKELLMSMRVEQAYSKDEIMEVYLTIAPFGTNIYGITTASEFYFDKEPKDLTLAEASVLAGIINSPALNSPTLNPNDGEERAKNRQGYILDQLLKYKDQINEQHRVNTNNPDAEDIITEDIIAAAREEELEYEEPSFGFKPVAGHFIDYVLQQLEQRNYKNGEEPFEQTDIQTGGYKIYTTLDLDVQRLSEQQIKQAMANQGAAYGAWNAALITMKPSTGEVISMVGSKNYNADSTGCNSEGRECKFDGQVNIITSKQSPGSSTKPHGYYEAYRQGLIFPGSSLPDIPYSIDGYELKNWNGQISGVSQENHAANVLRRSLNLPAIAVIKMTGVESFLNVMRDFGYTTYNDSSQFGESAILGGGDVIPLEHAQGYGVFANGGDFVQHEVITKIENRNGEVIYEHKPQRQRVADEQAVYLLNQSLNDNQGVRGILGSDMSSKTGTSENNRDVWLAAYSPDVVTIGWMGNNDNSRLNGNAYGSTAVAPWMRDYINKIKGSEHFNGRNNFNRPSGISWGGGCDDDGECLGEVVGVQTHLMINDKDYPVDNIREEVEVCEDQPNRLAREVDKQLGLSQERIAIRWLLPTPGLQADLDRFIAETTNGTNEIPSEPCDKNRSSDPVLQGVSATSVNGDQSVNISGAAIAPGGQIVSLEAYINYNSPGSPGIKLGDITVNADGSFDATFSYPGTGTMPNGTYQVGIIATDAESRVTAEPLGQVVVRANSTNTLQIISVSNLFVWGVGVGDGNSTSITLDYQGPGGAGFINSAELYYAEVGTGNYQLVGPMTVSGGPGYNVQWGSSLPNQTADYQFYVTATTNGGSLITQPVTTQITVQENP